MKKGWSIFLSLCLLSLMIPSEVIKIKSDEVLTCTVSQYSLISIEQTKDFSLIACFDTLDEAKSNMNVLTTDHPDLIITHPSSLSPLKIVAANRAIAASYPWRLGSTNTGRNYSTMNIHRGSNLSGDSTYIPGHRDMAYYETLSFNPSTGRGVIHVQISGFVGYANIIQVDLVPIIYIEKGWSITLGGRTFREEVYQDVNQEKPFTFVPRMNEYRVYTNTTRNVQEMVHETFSFYSGNSYGSYIYGFAPDWLPNGRYFSWDSITYYTDRAMTQPVLNGDEIGKYYNYYQYLPLRSFSHLTSAQLNQYMVALGFNKKATYYREPNASSMFDEGEAFTNGQIEYGVNALLTFAMGLHESGRGTSAISIDKNNIFGWGAADGSAYEDSHYFESVTQSIAEHMGRNLRGYLSVENWRFFGSILGNKNNGFNTKYASDPYWGNKIAGWAYRIDRYFDFVDYNTYQIAVIEDTGNLNVKKEPNSTSTTLFTIPSRTRERFVLVNNQTTMNSTQWVEFMTTQPISMDNQVIFWNETSRDLTPYIWYKSVGFLPVNSLNMVYDGGGIRRIPYLYDDELYQLSPIIDSSGFTLNNQKLSFNGFMFKPGLSIPYSQNIAYTMVLENSTISESAPIRLELNSGGMQPMLTVQYGQGRFVYDYATFTVANLDFTLFDPGIYQITIEANATVLSTPKSFSASLTSSQTLPSSTIIGKNRIHFDKDEHHVITLRIEEVDESELPVLRGDVNNDGRVTITDLVILHLSLAGLEDINQYHKVNADMNNDGRISITDLVMLHLYLAGVEYE